VHPEIFYTFCQHSTLSSITAYVQHKLPIKEVQVLF